jgi:hypothetical protein
MPKGNTPSINDDVRDIAARMRRVETRLTAYLVNHGESIGSAQPYWNPGDECVVVADTKCLLDRCMAVIPKSLSGNVYIRTEDFTYVATIHIGGEK